jgi:hypothetical protein
MFPSNNQWSVAMDFAELTRKRWYYYPDAEAVVRKELHEARNSYAMQRLAGNSLAAHGVREGLTRDFRQAITELRGELSALEVRRKSVTNAIKILERPVKWPLWPKENHSCHDDVMDDLMRGHRDRYRDKLEMLKMRNAVAVS